MKKTMFIIIFILVFCSLGIAEWESIGPYGGYLGAIAKAPSDDAIIYVASYANKAKIFRSTNAGVTWTKMGSVDTFYVYSMAVDPIDPDIIYAGSNMCVYKSTNGGATWTGYSVSDYYIFGLAVHPTSRSTVFAVGRVYTGSVYVMGFFKSTNGGMSWTNTELSSFNGISYCIALDHSDPSTIYVGGYYYDSLFHPSVCKSTDGGTNFIEVSSGISSSGMYVKSLAVHPGNPNIIYAGTYYEGIYRSVNAGTSWSLASSGVFIASLATTQADPTIAYAGSDTIIYKSTDSGASWFVTGTGFGGMYKISRGIVTSQSQASIVYTIDNRGVFKTTNSGSDWFETNIGINMASIADFGIAPSLPSTIYTEFEALGVFKSMNNGSDWTSLPTPLDCGFICEFAIDYSNPDRIFGLEGLG
jgi:hypothetical protein